MIEKTQIRWTVLFPSRWGGFHSPLIEQVLCQALALSRQRANCSHMRKIWKLVEGHCGNSKLKLHPSGRYSCCGKIVHPLLKRPRARAFPREGEPGHPGAARDRASSADRRRLHAHPQRPERVSRTTGGCPARLRRESCLAVCVCVAVLAWVLKMLWHQDKFLGCW